MASIAAPKYLKDIESKVNEKLLLLKKPRSEVLEIQQRHYDLVLAIYQEAFGSLIDNTVTYSDILNDIKNAYDKAIQLRNERISQFIIHDKMFGISGKKQEKDDKTRALLKQIEDLKEQNLKLTFDISKLKKEMGKLKDEQFSEYLCLMRERDARYTLYFENLGLQLKLKELDGSSYPLEQAYGDPVVLRIALDRCREQLSSVQTELKRVSEEYADTVPRREHDALGAEHRRLGAALAAARAQLGALTAEHDKLLANKKSIEEELSEVRERCTELERSGTPRPAWELCGDFVTGGRDRWFQLAGGLSSQETLRVLLKELGPAAESEHLEYFDGLGTGPEVPAYLRWQGRVRNLRLSRRDLCVLVHDIWRARDQHRSLPLDEYLALYFTERYQQPSMRAEWAYNVCARAAQALDEPSVQLLWGALHGRVSERRYWALRDCWRHLHDNLTRLARDKETVTVEEFERACKSTFPLKSEAEVRALSDAARRQLKLRGGAADINLDKLFEESPEGFLRGEVCRELHRQRGAAAERYLRELLAALGGRRARDRLVSETDFRRALAIIDPAIDHIRMEQYVRAAWGEESAPQPAPLHRLARRLAAADLQRAGPRTRAAATRYK